MNSSRIIILLALLLPANQIIAQNLLLNPGFDDGTIGQFDNIIQRVDNWTTTGLCGWHHSDYDENGPRFLGEMSLKIWADDGTAIYQDFTATGDTDYSVSVKAYSPSAQNPWPPNNYDTVRNRNARLRCKWYNNIGTQIGDSVIDSFIGGVEPDDQWVVIGNVLTSPAGSVTGRIQLDVDDVNASASGAPNFDDACVVDCSELIEVDFSSEIGPAAYPASGFLHSLSPSEPAAELLDQLKPQTFRMQPDSGSLRGGVFDNYDRINTIGADVQVVISDRFGYVTWGAPNWPGDNDDWMPWESCVEDLVNEALQGNYVLQYDIWNEPDIEIFWNPDGDKKAKFFETWKRAYQKIRMTDPSALIVGPSNSEYSGNLFSVEEFLIFARDNNVLPDILSWHVWDPDGVTSQVSQAKSFMLSNSISIDKISLNEYVHHKHQFEPGSLVSYFNNIESSGVDSAVRACWWVEGYDTCQNNCLDGLLTIPDNLPRSSWWTYKSYASMTGTLLDVTNNTKIAAIASKDPIGSMTPVMTLPQAHVLLGKSSIGGVDFCDVTVRFSGLDSVAYLKNGSNQSRLVIHQIPDNGTAALTEPILVRDEEITFTEPLDITIAGFEPGYAYMLSFYDPDAGTDLNSLATLASHWLEDNILHNACSEIPQADLDQDCKVSLSDLAILRSYWLK